MARFAVLKGILVTVAIIVFLVLASVSYGPRINSARIAAFGDWSSAVKIAENEMFFSDVSEFGLYELGVTSMTYTGDWGDSWVSEQSWSGRIDVVGDTIYRASADEYTLNLAFTKSTNNGSSWSSPVDLGLEGGDRFFGIFLLNDNLFVYGWDQTMMAIMLVRSDDYGSSWTSPIKVSDVEMTDPLANDMVLFDGRLYMVFYNQAYPPEPPYIRYDVTLISSDDMGDTWGSATVVGVGAMPLIKADGGYLYITYLHYDEVTFMDWTVEFTKSADGITWDTPKTVGIFTDMTDPVMYHSLSVSAGRIAVAYLDYEILVPADKYTVRINYSADDGASWNDLGDVTGTTTNQMIPLVNIVGDRLHFSWVDMGTDDWTGGPFPTYYRWMDISGPVIPEFNIVIVSVVTVAIIAAIFTRRESSDR